MTSYPSISELILVIRGQRVIVDTDLSWLYGTQTKVLNQAVKRNIERFPKDFLFRLTQEERDQLVTECDRFKPLKHSSSLPYAFTEHGALMAANVLNSMIAVDASIFVIRAFIQLRQILTTNDELASKLDELEKRLEGHDSVIHALVTTIRDLTDPILPEKRRRMGIRNT